MPPLASTKRSSPSWCICHSSSEPQYLYSRQWLAFASPLFLGRVAWSITSNVNSRRTAAIKASLRDSAASLIHCETICTASALNLKASSYVEKPCIRARCAAECAMIALKDAALDMSKGSQTSRIGLKLEAVLWVNIMVAYVLNPASFVLRDA